VSLSRSFDEPGHQWWETGLRRRGARDAQLGGVTELGVCNARRGRSVGRDAANASGIDGHIGLAVPGCTLRRYSSAVGRDHCSRPVRRRHSLGLTGPDIEECGLSGTAVAADGRFGRCGEGGMSMKCPRYESLLEVGTACSCASADVGSSGQMARIGMPGPWRYGTWAAGVISGCVAERPGEHTISRICPRKGVEM